MSGWQSIGLAPPTLGCANGNGRPAEWITFMSRPRVNSRERQGWEKSIISKPAKIKQFRLGADTPARVVSTDGARTASVNEGRDQRRDSRLRRPSLPGLPRGFLRPLQTAHLARPGHHRELRARVALPGHRRPADEPSPVSHRARGAQHEAPAVRPAAREPQPGPDQHRVPARVGCFSRRLLRIRSFRQRAGPGCRTLPDCMA